MEAHKCEAFLPVCRCKGTTFFGICKHLRRNSFDVKSKHQPKQIATQRDTERYLAQKLSFSILCLTTTYPLTMMEGGEVPITSEKCSRLTHSKSGLVLKLLETNRLFLLGDFLFSGEERKKSFKVHLHASELSLHSSEEMGRCCI